MKKSISSTRWVLSAVLIVMAAIVLSNFAVAQYHDDDRYPQRGYTQQGQQYGYQSGYRDGYAKGRHEGRERDPRDFNSEALQDATHGYQRWMGPVQYFQDGYRDGYHNGFRAGYQSVNRAWGNRDDNYGGYYPSGSYNGGQYSGNSAYQTGYGDGASVAREDVQNSKPYNPNPRGRYDDMDHGYRSEYGSKDAYKAQYANGYRAGYQSAMGRY